MQRTFASIAGPLFCLAFVLPLRADDLAQAQAAMARGDFAQATALLTPHVADPAAPITDAYAVQLEILRRIRQEFCLTPAQMLEKLRKSIPDVTADEIERWRATGQLQHRLLDGQVFYFSREPSNLWRFAFDAAARRVAPPPRSGWEFDIPAHLARVLAAADRMRATVPRGVPVEAAEEVTLPRLWPVRHHVRYELTVAPAHPRVKPGAKVRCWLPYPQDYQQQLDVLLKRNWPDQHSQPVRVAVAPSGSPHRTMYFELEVTDPAAPLAFGYELEYTCWAYVPDLDAAQARPLRPERRDLLPYLEERPPHIVFSPTVSAILAEIGDEPNPLERARRIFRWCCENLRYAYEVEYSTIPAIAEKALTTRRGDCGVQALAFITLCRAAGIPARWQSGWQTLPNGLNMHDWAEFYVEPWGWLPADPSYGLQEHADPRVREFYCGHLDPYRMIVNLDYARDLAPPKISFRSEPNDFQRGELEIDGHNLYFDEWDWSCDVRTVPLVDDFAAVEEALDAVVPAELARANICGAVVAVGRRTAAGFETWEKAYGYLQTQPAPIPMPRDAVFDLASMTKTIATGTSLLLLLERGQVHLEDPVAKYIPEFDTPGKRGVTVRHLMTHMAGLPPYVNAAEQKKLRDRVAATQPQTDAPGFRAAIREALRAHIRALPLAHAPGERVVYSCLNAILCGEIVSAASGQPLERFFAENVARPLQLADTGFLPSGRDARLVPTTRTENGRGAGGFLLGQVHDPLAAMLEGVAGNAGLFGTAHDVARVAQLLLNGGELDGVRILQAETVAAATRVQNEGGLNLKDEPDRRGLLWDLYVPDTGDTGPDAVFSYGHTGYTGTAVRIWPDRGVYAIVLANRVHPDDSAKVEALRRAVWRAVLRE